HPLQMHIRTWLASKHEAYGNLIFCCGGKLIFGPSWFTLMLSYLMITIPGVLFFVFVYYEFVNLALMRNSCSYFMKFSLGLGIPMAVVFGLLWISCLVLLTLTAFVEPGI